MHGTFSERIVFAYSVVSNGNHIRVFRVECYSYFLPAHPGVGIVLYGMVLYVLTHTCIIGASSIYKEEPSDKAPW